MTSPQPARMTLTVEQACAVFALQRLSKAAAEEATALRQFKQTAAADLLLATSRQLDTATERLIREFGSGLVIAQGLLAPA